MRIDDLSNEIAKQLSQYTAHVEEEVEAAKEDVTKEAVSSLKSGSPKDTGDYAKGWTRKKVGNSIIVHNRKYQLTHLLENGHVKVNGGRVAPRVHIKPVEEKMIDDFTERVERAARQ